MIPRCARRQVPSNAAGPLPTALSPYGRYDKLEDCRSLAARRPLSLPSVSLAHCRCHQSLLSPAEKSLLSFLFPFLSPPPSASNSLSISLSGPFDPSRESSEPFKVMSRAPTRHARSETSVLLGMDGYGSPTKPLSPLVVEAHGRSPRWTVRSRTVTAHPAVHS